MSDDEHLAYGDYHGRNEGEGDERGLVGDTFRKLRKNEGLGSIFSKVHSTIHGLGSEFGGKVAGQQRPSSSHGQGDQALSTASQNRFNSFAEQRHGDEVKWYVDGCGYMWAVSVAIERARESIWILDWWLSPELYLRRPPSRHEQYRLDRLLLAAAQRGVKVNIIVYKEVTQALTLSSAHTKHVLEALHPNISVFRHPDHLPDKHTLQSSFISSIQNMSITAATASKLPGDALKAVYGMNDDVILYWAHHEKLCLIDGETAFMGGLDLCYGRWDTNQHPIADAHPENLEDIVFPGQDFNNARIMDFQDVPRWENNKLDRTESSRMGWSDISVSLKGRVIEDLRTHFVDRWNFIYNEKYDVRKDVRYSRLNLEQQAHQGTHQGPQQPQSGYQAYHPPSSNQGQHQAYQGSQYQQSNSSQTPSNQYYQSQSSSYRDLADDSGDRDRGFRGGDEHGHFQRFEERGEAIRDRFEGHMHHMTDQHAHHGVSRPHTGSGGGSMSCQIVRSAAKWSNGNVQTEHSIANAYCDIIKRSQHFVYIENQFFITATGDKQKPIKNTVGAAIVERIVRAARAGEKFKVIVVIPAVPAFAGDLKDDAALGTRAIMEFQYDSINRGGHSIMEEIANAGFNPTDYIRFYNLRNYDRINTGRAMRQAELDSGVDYDVARRQHDAMLDPAGVRAQEGGDYQYDRTHQDQYQQYQQSASKNDTRWDTVSECYMLGGPDIREVPFDGGNIPEIETFVSEELYVHSKVLIADDRTVICGSANLNDRSQLGYHDSEIAIVVEDTETIDSSMDGRPWRAAKFAATLRRQLFRKHLGLLPAQRMEEPDQNFEPIGVPNMYDFDSAEDRVVIDPLSDQLLNLWNSRARQNTDALGRVFHPVPHDSVRTWADYDDFYERYFKEGEEEVEGKKTKKPAKYKWGHVVASEFSPGQQGANEVKDILATVKGTLVEMPLLFLIKEDIAKEGLSLNAFTEEVYT